MTSNGICYIRISSKNQSNFYGGNSLDSQKINCLKYANDLSVKISKNNIYTEIRSAKDHNRPVFKRMIRSIKLNVGVDLTY